MSKTLRIKTMAIFELKTLKNPISKFSTISPEILAMDSYSKIASHWTNQRIFEDRWSRVCIVKRQGTFYLGSFKSIQNERYFVCKVNCGQFFLYYTAEVVNNIVCWYAMHTDVTKPIKYKHQLPGFSCLYQEIQKAFEYSGYLQGKNTYKLHTSTSRL